MIYDERLQDIGHSLWEVGPILQRCTWELPFVRFWQLLTIDFNGFSQQKTDYESIFYMKNTTKQGN